MSVQGYYCWSYSVKKILFVVAIFILSVFQTSCEAVPKRFSASWFDVFDTAAEFTAYCSSEEEFDVYSDIVRSELTRLHEIFDIYNEHASFNACSLNLKKEGDCPSELCEVIESGIRWYERTDGQLNIALGSVLSLWHDSREKEILPEAEELSRRAQHCDIKKVSVDGKKVVLGDPELSLDFGALAKGYAVQKTAEKLIEAGAENFLLSVGGNVIAHGEKPAGEWVVGIENPDGGILTSFKIKDTAVVTSGDYQRFYEVDGVKYHHIIDPKTLFPADYWRSVTVICADSAVADALSTSLFCLPLADGKKLLEEENAEALWVDKSGAVTRSEGFPNEE